jgi:hypothetical protein
LNAIFDEDEKIEVGNNSHCGSENERVWLGSVGDFHSPDIIAPA